MRYKSIIIPILLVAFISCNQSNPGTGESSEPADIISNASFTDLDGNEVSIEDFKGKLVLMDFWESWCGPWLQVFPAMQELVEEHPDKFEVLAVTVGLNEGPEDARAFADEHNYDFNWLYDENGIFPKLGGQGIPFKVYVSPEGELIEIEMGSLGREGDYHSTKQVLGAYLDIGL